MSDYSYPYSVEVIVYLVCCFILTLSIGFMPPFFVRCMLPGRPLNRGSALLLVFLFFCVNLAVCAAMGGHTFTYAALIVVLWVSYRILHGGLAERQADEVPSSEFDELAAARVSCSHDSDTQGLSRPLGERLIWPMVFLVCALIIAVGTYYSLKVHYTERVSERHTLALLAQLAGANLDSSRQEGDAQSLNPAELARKVKPACVSIVTFDRKEKPTGFGSGFFINKEGQLITNYHVMAGASTARAKTETRKTYNIIGATATDESADIVSLRIDQGNAEVPFLALAETLPQVGERIAVVSTPEGFVNTFSEGSVSEYRELPPYGLVLQMTAPISKGSSGGPVLNMKGEVVGVATFRQIDGENLNFAIPCTILQALLQSKGDFRLKPHPVTMT